MFEVIVTKEELYDKCENIEQLYDKFYYPLLVEYKELKKKYENAVADYETAMAEKEQLKKKLEEINKMIEKCGFVNIEQVMLNYCGLLTQQKEFIKYLEDEIYSIEPKGTGINYNCEYDSENDYVMAMREQSRLNTLKENLQKYKKYNRR